MTLLSVLPFVVVGVIGFSVGYVIGLVVGTWHDEADR